ncbi:hypothetical protein OQY15_04655 [Pedobacter sp. MC2016-15]|uniref:hypothetical protein n=1 Tax=Pedobacter sp. MC2016-15 TaxID=2994473 RepID=UPI002246F0DA|nr:hypothetical protein [Pedobacter sp. MC2016-15]MCX2478368.1 hypothetical protein [Pedobacter sp. MC2016-15]
MTKPLLLITTIILLMSSCKKSSNSNEEPENVTPNIPTIQSCVLSSWNDINGLEIKYTYDAQGRITGENIAAPNFYELPSSRKFEWKSDKITVTEAPANRSYDLSLTSNRVSRFTFLPDRYSTVTYSNDGYISKISDYKISDNTLLLTKEFLYTAGNLTSIISTRGIGTASVIKETYLLDYYVDKKAIDGADIGLNNFILPNWDLSDAFAPYQLPAGIFGKSSTNLLKSVRYPLGEESFNFIYDFDAAGKPIKMTYKEPNSKGGLNIVSFNYICPN